MVSSGDDLWQDCFHLADVVLHVVLHVQGQSTWMMFLLHSVSQWAWLVILQQVCEWGPTAEMTYLSWKVIVKLTSVLVSDNCRSVCAWVYRDWNAKRVQHVCLSGLAASRFTQMWCVMHHCACTGFSFGLYDSGMCNDASPQRGKWIRLYILLMTA